MTFYTRKSGCKEIKILPSAQSPPKGILRGFFALKSQFVGIGSILTSEKISAKTLDNHEKRYYLCTPIVNRQKSSS